MALFSFVAGTNSEVEKSVLPVNDNIGVMLALDRSVRNMAESMQQLSKPMKAVPF